MRRSAGLSAVHDDGTAGDPDRAEFLLHAVGNTESSCRQRAQHARAADAGAIQGLAGEGLTWRGLRLLFDGQEEARTPDDEDQERRERLSHGAAVDDQPLNNAAPRSARSNLPRPVCGARERKSLLL